MPISSVTVNFVYIVGPPYPASYFIICTFSVSLVSMYCKEDVSSIYFKDLFTLFLCLARKILVTYHFIYSMYLSLVFQSNTSLRPSSGTWSTDFCHIIGLPSIFLTTTTSAALAAPLLLVQLFVLFFLHLPSSFSTYFITLIKPACLCLPSFLTPGNVICLVRNNTDDDYMLLYCSCLSLYNYCMYKYIWLFICYTVFLYTCASLTDVTYISIYTISYWLLPFLNHVPICVHNKYCMYNMTEYGQQFPCLL